MHLRCVVILCAFAWFLAPTVASADRAQRVAAGFLHTCAVTAAGGVKCWGDNSYRQLGDGTTTRRTTPTDVSGLTSGVVAVTSCQYHTCALTAAGGVKCWGYNSTGQLGDGTYGSRATPVDVLGLTSGVVAVAAGAGHTCAVTADGALKCWGANSSGQIGDGTTTNRTTPTDVSALTTGVAMVAAGWTHTCALTTQGGVKCWGTNRLGQLGNGTWTDRVTPTDVSGLTSGVTAVAAGSSHTCALNTAGGVTCWGYNAEGQLGDGTATSRATAVPVSGLTNGVSLLSGGGSHTCALAEDGGVKCWGWNSSGQLGDGTTTSRPTPADVAGMGRGVTALEAGVNHTCAVTAGGGVRCWGTNDGGQVGDGTWSVRTVPTDVPGLTSGVSGVTVGQYHTCAVTNGGGARCWGQSWYGQLGDGTTTTRVVPTDVLGLTSGITAVAASELHTCALTTGGGVKCWGSNSHGQLGDGTTTQRLAPTDVVGLTDGVAAVSVGYLHTCVLTIGGGVKCWGENSSGQLGDGTTTPRRTPTDVPDLAAGVTAVAAGAAHTCALLTGGGAKCWGSNASGQLGDGTTTQRLTPTDVSGLSSGVAALGGGWTHSCVLTTGGGAKCWGNNYYGQLGIGSTAQRLTPTDIAELTSGVIAVAAGAFHTCALTAGGGVKCWGSNVSGQLGDGTTTNRTRPTDVSGLASGVAAVVAGQGSYSLGSHTCAVLSGGGLKCWGYNNAGQLGDPTSGPRITPTRALGFGQPDFDRDDRADVAIYRPSAGTWFSLDSSTNNTTYQYRGWGVQAQVDVPALGDFDGDGVIDPTVFRPAVGTWFILESHANYTTWNWFGWGEATDTLVPGDYDGDGKTDAAVYRSSTGTWYVRPSSGATPWNVVFGQAGDIPIAGDFDGDGKRDIAVYRPASGTWFWLKSSTNFTTYDYYGWGVQAQGDLPAPGDYDGDGKTDLCVFRPASGTWFILESRAGWTTWNWFGWGNATDTLVPADFDGDGKTDAAVYRGSTGEWFVRPSSGATPWNVVFGAAGDVPLGSIR